PTCLFFFSSRRRHTRFSRDWSSDVCSSDLEDVVPADTPEVEVQTPPPAPAPEPVMEAEAAPAAPEAPAEPPAAEPVEAAKPAAPDRKSVVEGERRGVGGPRAR